MDRIDREEDVVRDARANVERAAKELDVVRDARANVERAAKELDVVLAELERLDPAGEGRTWCIGADGHVNKRRLV